MTIQTYTGAQLQELITSAEFSAMPVVPISTHRAISHMHNTRLDADDIIMIIAREEGIMVGYLGVLADSIYNTNGEGHKCGWLSCMWVDPVQRGKGIAKQLLNTAFAAWDDHILVTEFTPEAKGLYDRSQHFTDLRSNHGLRCYVRFNLHEILPKKDKKYELYEPLLKAIDTVANVPIGIRLALKPKPELSALRFEHISFIDDDTAALISSQMANGFERRGREDLDWIMRYPWLENSPPTNESRRYHFSSVADRFQNVFVKIMDGRKVTGFIHLTIRDDHMKIPYAYIAPDDMKDAMDYLEHQIRTMGINMLTVFHKDIVSYFQNNSSPFIYKRPIKRNYIITKKLAAHFPDRDQLVIQDGDADCAFT